jgi:hypothetical protein
MGYAVIWKYVDKDGDTKVLTGHPGAFGKDEQEAITEGQKVHEALTGYDLTPLAVAQTDADIDEDIYACEELYLGPDDGDEIFYDVSVMGKWQSQPWWPR